MAIELPAPTADPLTTTPPRRARSVRLTTHMDIESRDHGELCLRGGARTLRTSGTFGTSAASSTQISSAVVEAQVGSDRLLIGLETSSLDGGTSRGAGTEKDLSSLVGRSVGSGFRAAVDSLFGETDDVGNPLHLLLDDLPAAALISGYAGLYSGKMQIEPKHLERGLLRADICSGWSQDATMLTTLRERGSLPVPIGPPTTRLERADDPLAWHEMKPLAPGAMRRRRLVEVATSTANGEQTDDLDIYAMFRDTHVSDEGAESILHEYEFTAKCDPVSHILSSCVAHPRVLPWKECPAAAASASWLDGRRVDDLRAFVAREMRGTSTCTHLNDLLRSVSRVGGLLQYLP